MSASRLKAKIEELSLKNSDLSETLENERKQNTLKIETLTSDHETEISTLKETVDGLKVSLKEKEAQLDRKELKKLAEAFSEQERVHILDQKKWFRYLIVAAGILSVYAVLSLTLTLQTSWIDRIGYYLIDAIFISAVWFCSTQFSASTRLRYDYGNRKTLAQSFHNILNNLAEDESIRVKFIEKTTDVLCAPVGTNEKEPILTKKVLKDFVEIMHAGVKG